MEGGHRGKFDPGLAFSGAAVDVNDKALEGMRLGAAVGKEVTSSLQGKCFLSYLVCFLD